MAAPAAAATDPLIEAAPAWVQAENIPAPDPKRGDLAVQGLLTSNQTRHSPAGDEYYLETAILVQSPQGLAAAGTLQIPWQPERADLIIHKVEIIRSGKTIDALAGSQKFTVLRRENNLESAVLDGTLTAVLQPEGLQVGDTLHLAFTMRSKQGAIPFRAESIVLLQPDAPVRKVFVREVWPEGSPMRWRATPAMGAPKPKQTKLGTELIVNLDEPQIPASPEDAPLRFKLPAMLQVSGYSDWPEVSRLLAPSYAKAVELSSDSPLKAEIAKIAAATPDPRQRAIRALQLVEDQIRYVALAMGDAGYIPATADQTWSRKYGDCKGKTVALIAILKGLGIEAEPVLVSAVLGDLLGDSLPQMKLFDHVLVRAKIDGRAYWLDGTRLGDRQLEDLLATPFPYGLPIRAAGAALEATPAMPPQRPLTDTRIIYDATKGIFGPVPIAGEIVMTGDLASTLRIALAQIGRDAFLKKARDFVQALPGGTDAPLDLRDDQATGSFTISYKGKARLDWDEAGTPKQKRFHFSNQVIEWAPDFDRKADPVKSIPVALIYPVFLGYTETLLLPSAGKGFSLSGKDLDRTVAGTRITRTLTLADGKAIAHSTFVRLQREISAEEARSSLATLKTVSADRADLLAPAGSEISAAERKLILETEPTTAREFVERGYQYNQDGNYKKAIQDFDKAAGLEPEWSLPVSDRAIALIHTKKLDEAEADLKKAASLDEDDFVVHQGYGMLHSRRGEDEQAVASYSRSLELDPENPFTLRSRATAYERLGKLREALADLNRAIEADPKDEAALWERARVRAGLGEADLALADSAALIARHPDDSAYIGIRGELLYRLGRRDEAKVQWAKAVSQIDRELEKPSADYVMLVQQKASILSMIGQPVQAVAIVSEGLKRYAGSVVLLQARCRARWEGNLELPQALKDCDEADRAEPGRLDTLLARGMLKIRLQRWADAVTDFDKAIAAEPFSADAWFGRGLAKTRAGQREAGEHDLKKARQLSFDIDSQYASVGLGEPKTSVETNSKPEPALSPR